MYTACWTPSIYCKEHHIQAERGKTKLCQTEAVGEVGVPLAVLVCCCFDKGFLQLGFHQFLMYLTKLFLRHLQLGLKYILQVSARVMFC